MRECVKWRECRQETGANFVNNLREKQQQEEMDDSIWSFQGQFWSATFELWRGYRNGLPFPKESFIFPSLPMSYRSICQWSLTFPHPLSFLSFLLRLFKSHTLSSPIGHIGAVLSPILSYFLSQMSLGQRLCQIERVGRERETDDRSDRLKRAVRDSVANEESLALAVYIMPHLALLRCQV